MTLSREQLQRVATETGFSLDSLEKVWMLVRLLNQLTAHPFLGPRVVLKGGTALNLFIFDLPRLSVDIDLNYVGSTDREVMLAERPKLDDALVQVVARAGLIVKRRPDEHAGGKWKMSYTSVLGRPAILEVDINYMLRAPLWDVERRDSPEIVGERATQTRLLEPHELAAGKLAALLARRASRDLFDARELLALEELDEERLRIAFVVYGGINRVDWRTLSVTDVTTTADDVKSQLLPMLRRDVRPEATRVEGWTAELVDETRTRLAKVLPLREHERRFLDRLNDDGELEPALLTADRTLQDRITSHPGLQWKAQNVRKHRR